MMEGDAESALTPEAAAEFRGRWHEVQAAFVDDPRRAVAEADQLVSDIARAFADGVETRRQALTSAWVPEGNGETEQLRLTLRQYRSLADHMLGS